MSTQLVTYDPFAPGFLADPYAQYRQLREENPAHFTKFGPPRPMNDVPFTITMR